MNSGCAGYVGRCGGCGRGLGMKVWLRIGPGEMEGFLPFVSGPSIGSDAFGPALGRALFADFAPGHH